jgi:hypothetical protein
MPDLVCYCFGYTADDIRRDYRTNGHSTILEKIKTEKKFGNCQCATKNPKGRCCLAEVRQVVNRISGRSLF